MGYKTYTCPIAKECGGCEWLAVPYPIQLKRKQEFIDNLFEELLENACIQADEIRGMDKPLAYRYKAASPYAPSKKSLVKSGFYKGGTHELVACEHCLVEAAGLRECLNTVAHVATQFKLDAYNEDKGRGLLRHAVVRKSYRAPGAHEEMLLTLVTNGQGLKHERRVVEALIQERPELTGIVQNINQKRTNAILGSQTKVLYGTGTMQDSLLGCSFEIGPTSFYQTNPKQTELLYQLVLDGLPQQSSDTSPLRILDAYCGCGTIGICAAAHKKNVELVGVEKGAEAVERARINAELNHLDDTCRFVQADASAWINDAAKRGKYFDAVILDPPRAGSTPEFMRALVALAPKQIIYVSCNPVTQVRDLVFLLNGSYQLQRLTPVDMFPHTKHIETVCVLSHKRF